MNTDTSTLTYMHHQNQHMTRDKQMTSNDPLVNVWEQLSPQCPLLLVGKSSAHKLEDFTLLEEDVFSRPFAFSDLLFFSEESLFSTDGFRGFSNMLIPRICATLSSSDCFLSAASDSLCSSEISFIIFSCSLFTSTNKGSLCPSFSRRFFLNISPESIKEVEELEMQ